MSQATAVEFFSGMGSFHEACRFASIRVIAAFDQNSVANAVYAHNFGLKPSSSNLDSISAEQIPDADIWWMSPPCTPYSVRGNRSDISDSRAQSFLRLIEILPLKKPEFIFLENVTGFSTSEARQRFLQVLTLLDYSVQERQLCSTNFGIPMKRPRNFIVAARNITLSSIHEQIGPFERQALKHFLNNQIDHDFENALIMPEEEFKKYEAGLNIVDPDDDTAVCICFTKNYYRCRSASGSLIQSSGTVRRFSSRELLNLFGFATAYNFPSDISEEVASRLLGNAVDVRAIRYLLEYMSNSICSTATQKGSLVEGEPLSSFNQ